MLKDPSSPVLMVFQLHPLRSGVWTGFFSAAPFCLAKKAHFRPIASFKKICHLRTGLVYSFLVRDFEIRASRVHVKWSGMRILYCGGLVARTFWFLSRFIPVDAFSSVLFCIKEQKVHFFPRGIVLCRLQGITCVCLKALSVSWAIERVFCSVFSLVHTLPAASFSLASLQALFPPTRAVICEKGRKCWITFEAWGKRVVGRTGRKITVQCESCQLW